MPPDPKTPSLNDNPEARNTPPPLPAMAPPVIAAPLHATAASPPPLTPKSNLRRLVAILLSSCVLLFLADALVSLADNSLLTFFKIGFLTAIHGVVFFFGMLVALLIYCLMALTPMIPKRIFLPLTLFNPVAGFLMIPFLIYFYGRGLQVAWVISLVQVLFALIIMRWCIGSFRLRLPLVAQSKLGARSFSWLNLFLFLAVNVFGLLPALLLYCFFCAALAVHHFSEGFVALRPSGMTVQVRKYLRQDGKTILLVPMSHVGEPEFYRDLSQSFPTNAIILMEGVTDNHNLLTNKITYKRMAKSLHLAEQQKEFRPKSAEWVHADVDVEQFGTNTLGFLNLVMRLHAKGVSTETVLPLIEFSAPPDFEQQLFDDLLRKRNRRLLEEIQSRLSESENLIVPWGAAHMPEIAREIQQSGFRLEQAREYTAIRFRSAGNQGKKRGPKS